ncbi:MFS transporter [uncultured Microbacterium sp.]|uniref:MFS transporter n=1 Tax=uncultured Microbacterium sp. TaxID=191216 RepID=UPI00262B10DF|nr:MFS transporter [uncultured Microbacterium sp.]
MTQIVKIDGAAAGEKPQKLIGATFVLSWMVNVFQYIVMYFLITTMALYAVRQFAASDAAAGFASSAFVVGATVARLFTGYIVDRFGRRRIMILGLIAATVITGLYLTAASLPLLIIVRLVHGFAYAFMSTAVMALVQSAIPASRRAEGTGYFALGSTLAAAVGPALALFMVGSFSYELLFQVALGSSMISLVLGLFLRDPARSSRAALPARPKLTLRAIMDPAVIPIGIFMLLIGLCYSGVITYLNAYAEQRDVVTGASLFFVAYALSMLIMRFILGKVQDRRGDNAVIYFGLFFFVLALALLSFATADWQVIVAGMLSGLGYGSLMPAAQAIAVNAVPAHKLGTGISTLLLLADAGIGLGPIALGILISATGYGTMYLLLAGIAVIAVLFYQFTHGRRPEARRGRGLAL